MVDKERDSLSVGDLCSGCFCPDDFALEPYVRETASFVAAVDMYTRPDGTTYSFPPPAIFREINSHVFIAIAVPKNNLSECLTALAL
jgi:hypothetical protein